VTGVPVGRAASSRSSNMSVCNDAAYVEDVSDGCSCLCMNAHNGIVEQKHCSLLLSHECQNKRLVSVVKASQLHNSSPMCRSSCMSRRSKVRRVIERRLAKTNGEG